MNRFTFVGFAVVLLPAGMTQAQGRGGRREPVAGQTDPNLCFGSLRKKEIMKG